MAIVRETDHDDADLGMGGGHSEVVSGVRDAVAGREGPRPLSRVRVDDADPVAAAPAKQRVRVELADQPGAEEREGLHGPTIQDSTRLVEG
jgi:hypothetical protein